jgi:excisionase family DNA binding protein
VSDLDRILGADLVSALEQLVDERIEAALRVRVHQNGESPWLALADAANYLGVSPRTIARLLDRGRIRSTTIGRRRLLHRDDLDLYLRGDAQG